MVTSIRELRASTKEILSAVGRGETVWITNRGKTCAKIVGLDQPKKTKDHPAFGMWKDHKETEDVHAYLKKIRKAWRRHVI
ncbi:MAG: type II toxin-antitoxin system prevent-host-death family antitoxin [Candidatus Omnitrophica bacterium]|nr:type II toxin-antitoxin system prevent-host-death family antitoxin [Candidatus Omnitrophota bacterium]